MANVIHKSSRFERDLVEILDYLGTEDVDVAIRFVEAIERTLVEISEMPGLGNPLELQAKRLEGVRCGWSPVLRNTLFFIGPLEKAYR